MTARCDMLGGLSPGEVMKIAAERVGSPLFAEMYDEQVRLRALETAAGQGLFERFERELDADGPLPELRYWAFREFQRTGNRTRFEAPLFRRSGQVDLAALAVYLGVDRRDLLADLLWAECESAFWVMPAHEDPRGPIDLRVAMCGFLYPFLCETLTNRVPTEVKQRVRDEVRRRVLGEYLDDRRYFWWKRFSNNWNAVCNAGVALAAMLVESEPQRLGRILVEVLRSLPPYLSGFPDDGGCSEGPSYWRFGFHWYVLLAAALHNFTGGRIDIMTGEKIARICRYPLAVSIAPGQDVPFADAHQGYLDAATAVLINRFVPAPGLYGLCRLTDGGALAVGSLLDLLLCDGRTVSPSPDRADYLLPDLAVVKVRAGDVTVATKAGNNDEHHNHNDVGSFVVHRGRTYFLTDLGAPVYSRKTFSPQRYDSVFCNSFGHSVPLVNGRQQPAGGRYAGTLAAEGLNGPGPRRMRVEMAGAYDDPSLMRLSRLIEVPPDGGQLRLADEFAFSTAPGALEEAFITTLPAEVEADGKVVVLRSQSDGLLRLKAEAPGRFEVAELREESQAEGRHGEVIRRVRFVPSSLAQSLRLEFRIGFA